MLSRQLCQPEGKLLSKILPLMRCWQILPPPRGLREHRYLKGIRLPPSGIKDVVNRRRLIVEPYQCKSSCGALNPAAMRPNHSLFWLAARGEYIQQRSTQMHGLQAISDTRRAFGNSVSSVAPPNRYFSSHL